MTTDIIKQLADIGTTIFRTLLPLSAEGDGTFRTLLTCSIDGETKPLLLIGNAHRRIEDGTCIAVWNPDQELVQELIAGCGYNEAQLKELVGGRCDAMALLWIELYVKDTTTVLGKYKAREFKSARFTVR